MSRKAYARVTSSGGVPHAQQSMSTPTTTRVRAARYVQRRER
jgi:hypothetical protein